MSRLPLLIIQFAKAPLPGKVKTRLSPAVSEQQACDIHIDLLQHCCRQLLAAELGPVELWVDAQPDHPVFTECLNRGAIGPRRQQGKDLGERMYHALTDSLNRYQQVILVGSDCPGIDRDYLLQAQQSLVTASLVIGPAADGGYVLIAAAGQVDAALFEDIAWGTSKVYQQTLERARLLHRDCGALPQLRDIDRPEDLSYWRSVQGRDREI